MNDYVRFELWLEDRIFVKNINDDLLSKSLYVLKSEKKRRFKQKFNSILKLKVF